MYSTPWAKHAAAKSRLRKSRFMGKSIGYTGPVMLYSMFRCCLALLAVSALAQRPFTPADTVAVHNIGELAPSPDGKVILFSVDGKLMRISGGDGGVQPVGPDQLLCDVALPGPGARGVQRVPLDGG